MTTSETPNVQLVSALDRRTVHLGKQGRFAGSVVSSCNGRTMALGQTWVGSADQVTCKACRKTWKV